MRIRQISILKKQKQTKTKTKNKYNVDKSQTSIHLPLCAFANSLPILRGSVGFVKSFSENSTSQRQFCWLFPGKSRKRIYKGTKRIVSFQHNHRYKIVQIDDGDWLELIGRVLHGSNQFWKHKHS